MKTLINMRLPLHLEKQKHGLPLRYNRKRCCSREWLVHGLPTEFLWQPVIVQIRSLLAGRGTWAWLTEMPKGEGCKLTLPVQKGIHPLQCWAKVTPEALTDAWGEGGFSALDTMPWNRKPELQSCEMKFLHALEVWLSVLIKAVVLGSKLPVTHLGVITASVTFMTLVSLNPISERVKRVSKGNSIKSLGWQIKHPFIKYLYLLGDTFQFWQCYIKTNVSPYFSWRNHSTDTIIKMF